MKTKLLLTLLLCTCMKFAFGAITINGPSTAVSGADITFTAAGETATSYIVAVTLDKEDSAIPSGVVVSDPDLLKMYNAGISVGTFKTNAFLPQGGPQAVITYAFTVQIQGQVDPTVIKKTVTITPSTAPPSSNYGLVAGSNPSITGYQIFFTVTGETNNNSVTAATYDAGKSTIPPGITISGQQVSHLWIDAGEPTVMVAVATINSGSSPITCTIAWDLTIKGVTGKVTVSASVTVVPPSLPVTNNVIALSPYTFGGPLTITGQNVTGGTGSPIYHWEINTTSTTPAGEFDDITTQFDQVGDNAITHTIALTPIYIPISIRRRVTFGTSVYYSNVVTITPPTYTGTPVTIIGAPGEQNANGFFITTKNTTITLTIQNPNPNVTYTWYYEAIKPPLKTIYLGTGTSMSCNSGASVFPASPPFPPSESAEVDVYGSDGSRQIFSIRTTP